MEFTFPRSGLTAPQVRVAHRSDVVLAYQDWGNAVDGSETGPLDDADTMASCTVSVLRKPSGASDPTLGSVTADSGTPVVNGRTVAANEATSGTITMASDQAYGEYVLEYVGTTTASRVHTRCVRIRVEPC